MQNYKREFFYLLWKLASKSSLESRGEVLKVLLYSDKQGVNDRDGGWKYKETTGRQKQNKSETWVSCWYAEDIIFSGAKNPLRVKGEKNNWELISRPY